MRSPLPAGVVLCALILAACSDTPTDTAAAAAGPTSAAMTAADPPPFRGMVLRTARVSDDGELLGGTAVAASQVGDDGDGSYLVEFGSPIADCVASAQNALFEGSGASQNLINTQVLIGYGPGLVQNDTWVTVNHYHTFNPDFNRDSAFTLLLVCPS